MSSFGNTRIISVKARRGKTLESSKATKARAICNPASGGGYDPDGVKKELGGFDIEWIPTKKPGDTEEADEPVEFEVIPREVVVGEGYVAEPER